MRIADCCRTEVIVADRGISIPEAARIMREYHVGGLVVVDRMNGTSRPVGIVTDRDLVMEVLAQNVPVEELKVDDVMSTEPAVAAENDDVLDTLQRMCELCVRRMPVVNEKGALTGIIAADDLLEVLANSVNSLVGLVIGEIFSESERRP